MVKINNVWSFRNQVYVETDEGITYMFADEVTTKDIRDRIKAMREEGRLGRKAMEEKTITPSLQHLKELEGEELE